MEGRKGGRDATDHFIFYCVLTASYILLHHFTTLTKSHTQTLPLTLPLTLPIFNVVNLTVHDNLWNLNFQNLLAFHAANHHYNVPYHYCVTAATGMETASNLLISYHFLRIFKSYFDHLLFYFELMSNSIISSPSLSRPTSLFAPSVRVCTDQQQLPAPHRID